MGTADVPALPLPVRRQDERALACADQYPYLAHPSPSFGAFTPVFPNSFYHTCTTRPPGEFRSAGRGHRRCSERPLFAQACFEDVDLFLQDVRACGTRSRVCPGAEPGHRTPLASRRGGVAPSRLPPRRRSDVPDDDLPMEIGQDLCQVFHVPILSRPRLRRVLRARRIDPEAAQRELDRVEGLDADRVGATAHRDDRPGPVPQPEHLQGTLRGVHEPRVSNARLRVDSQLPAPVDPLGGGREDLANPVGGEGEEGDIRYRGHALPSPTGQVGHDHVLAEVQLGLEEDSPASGTIMPVAERDKGAVELGAGNRVPRRRPRAQEELAVQDLGHLVLGGAQHVFVGRSLQTLALRWYRTSPVYAPARRSRKIPLSGHHPPPTGRSCHSEWTAKVGWPLPFGRDATSFWSSNGCFFGQPHRLAAARPAQLRPIIHQALLRRLREIP